MGKIPLCDGLHECDDGDLVSSGSSRMPCSFVLPPQTMRAGNWVQREGPACPCTQARAASEARFLSRVLCCCETGAAVPSQQPTLAQDDLASAKPRHKACTFVRRGNAIVR